MCKKIGCVGTFGYVPPSVKWTRNSTKNLKLLPQIKTLGMIAHSANNLVRNDLFTKLYIPGAIETLVNRVSNCAISEQTGSF